MADDDPRWPTPSAAERAVALVALTGGALALAALAAIALLGARAELMVIFWCGFAVLVVATLVGLLVQRAVSALRGPLRTVAAGFLLLMLGLLLDGGGVPGDVRVTAHVLLLAGIGWGLWELGGLRR
ncbi:MAG: hypothetical protein RLW61_05655 [Gammaproteobacteria bacterium]